MPTHVATELRLSLRGTYSPFITSDFTDASDSVSHSAFTLPTTTTTSSLSSSAPPPAIPAPATREDVNPTLGKSDYGHVKRPENAFILFRKQKCEEDRIARESTSPRKEKIRQAELSKIISRQWKTLSLEERKYWDALAQTKKAWHGLMYPDYVYRPRPRKKRKPKVNNRNKSEDTRTQTICLKSNPRSPNDTKNRAPTHATDDSDTACIAVGPLPPPESRAQDFSTLRTSADQALSTCRRQQDADLVVGIQRSSEGALCSQSFADSTLDDRTSLLAGHNFLAMEDNFGDDAYTNESVIDEFVFSLSGTSTTLQETWASGSMPSSVWPVLDSDKFEDLPDWNETIVSTPLTPHQKRQEDIPGDIDHIESIPLPWEQYTNLADLVHGGFDWHPELAPA